MRLLKILLSKEIKKEYSRELVNKYNEINNKIEEIYLEVSKEYKETIEHVA